MNLKQLSELLGLSQTTVSRALNGYPEVREETRRKVQDAAQVHGYSPSRRARSLATGRSFAIGHVIPVSANHEMVNPVFSDFIAGAGEVYSKNGYDMLLSVVRDTDELQAYRDLAAKGSVDGIIVHGPRIDDPRVALLQDIGLPFVVHGRLGQETSNYSYVDINNGSAFRRATEFLFSLGHRRIGLVNGIETMDFARRRRLGYLEAHAAAGITADEALMMSSEMTEPFGYSAATQMLGLPNPPSAFLVSSVLAAIGVRRAVHTLGLTLGRDVSVVTHDDVLSYVGNGEDVPIFTASRSSVRDAGRRCAEILMDQIQTPDQPTHQELWECELTLGASTGPGPAQARST